MTKGKSMTTKVLSLLLLLLLIFVTFSANHAALGQGTKKGPASDKIIFTQVPLDVVPDALKSGKIDYYIYALRPAQAEALKGIQNVSLYYAPAGIVDIICNPAPRPDGLLNPLSIREVRFALNYIMNREYIVNEIYKGFASPMFTFLSSYDPDFKTIYDLIAKYNFKYDPMFADELITEALTKAGATKVAGKWQYGGKPITLKFVIRIEDERREIGDAFATELEKLGFTVERLYMPFAQAIDVIYGTDPKDHEWDLYTEGWGKGAPDKYDYGTISQYGAPWFGYMPGWQEPTFWNYMNDTIDNLTRRIFAGQFTSKQERDDLYRKASDMIIQESIRIFAATRLDINPALTSVQGLTLDLGAGLRSIFNPREVYVPGKSEVRVGHLWVHTATSVWNPVGGHSDVYSVDIWRAIYDPLVWRHPFSGEPIPFRSTYEVTTAGPNSKLDVPPDAFLWNATTQRWELVGTGVKATSKVSFDLSSYVGTKWHHNVTITWGDVLYSIYTMWNLVYNSNWSALEPAIASANKEIFDKIKGYRIVGDSILEVYVDYWHFDSNYIADFASPPLLHYPWEVLAAMNDVVFNKKAAAYSQSSSKARNVPWLSMVLKDHVALVTSSLKEFSTKGFFPTNVFTVAGKLYESPDKVALRYSASLNWANTYGNLVISDGPFYLYRYDPAAQYAEIRAFRDPTYPFSPGKWYFGVPQAPSIVNIGVPTVVPGGDARIVVELKGPAPLGVKFLVRDPVTGEVLTVGLGEAVTPTRFVISLPATFTSTLEPGLYELTVIGYSESVAFLSTETRFFDVLNIKPITGPIEESLTSMEKSLTGQISLLSSNVVNSMQQLTSSISTLNSLLVLTVILLIVNLLISIYSLMKKK